MIVQSMYSLCIVHVQFKGIAKYARLSGDVPCMYSVCTVHIQFMYSSFAAKIILKKNNNLSD